MEHTAPAKYACILCVQTEYKPELAAFPYVNGGLFANEDIEIPPFTDEIRDLLLTKASSDFLKFRL